MTDTAQQRSAGLGVDGRVVVRVVLRIVAALVRLVTLLAAAVLVIHIVLAVIPSANKENAIFVFFADWADRLSLGFGSLFVPRELPMNIVLDYGIAAVVWLVAGMIVVRILRTLGAR